MLTRNCHSCFLLPIHRKSRKITSFSSISVPCYRYNLNLFHIRIKVCPFFIFVLLWAAILDLISILFSTCLLQILYEVRNYEIPFQTQPSTISSFLNFHFVRFRLNKHFPIDSLFSIFFYSLWNIKPLRFFFRRGGDRFFPPFLVHASRLKSKAGHDSHPRLIPHLVSSVCLILDFTSIILCMSLYLIAL